MGTDLFYYTMWCCVLLSAVPTLFILVQVLASILPRSLDFPDQVTNDITAVVVIPAHNEGRGAAKTARSVQNAGGPGMRILVVADNCQDDTVQHARDAGVEVIERHDLSRRGKAYALGFAVEHLRSNPPDVVIVVDADSLVGGRLMRLAAVAHRWRRPVQALNLIDRRRSSDRHAAVQTLGNRFHNLVRPLGNAKLGWPCLLMGSGMAFPWEAVAKVGLQNDSLGEDKQLGIDMTLAGFAPAFYPRTKIASYVPDRYAAYLGQRTRWEHGHLVVAVTAIPQLLRAVLRQRSLRPFWMALDLIVPPIAVQVMLWSLATILTLTWGIWSGRWGPAGIMMAVALMQFVAFLVTWLMFSRRRVPNRDILAVPGYVLKKLPIYLSLLTRGPQRVWLRSDRAGDDCGPSAVDSKG